MAIMLYLEHSQLIVLQPFLKKGLKIGVTPTEGITKQMVCTAVGQCGPVLWQLCWLGLGYICLIKVLNNG